MNDELKSRMSEGAYKIDLKDAPEEIKEELRETFKKLKEKAEKQGPFKLSPETERRLDFIIAESFGNASIDDLFDEIDDLKVALKKIDGCIVENPDAGYLKEIKKIIKDIL